MSMLLQINNLNLSFKGYGGAKQVLHDVNLHIKKGERVALVGESGSGKSVIARIIAGLLHELPNARIDGEVFFKGQDLEKLRPKARYALQGQDITMISQDPTSSLNPVFTIGEQFYEVLKVAKTGLNRKDAFVIAKQHLLDVSIDNPDRVLDSYAFQLSGGMNQRVMIAMALANKPDLLLADEPGTALDVTVQAQTLELMHQLVSDSGTSVLFISHSLGVVREFAERIYVIYKGRIVEQGSIETLFSDPKHAYTKALISAIPRITGDGIPDIQDESPDFYNPIEIHAGFEEPVRDGGSQ